MRPMASSSSSSSSPQRLAQKTKIVPGALKETEARTVGETLWGLNTANDVARLSRQVISYFIYQMSLAYSSGFIPEG